MSEIERRGIAVQVSELRAEEGDSPRLAGYAAVFSSRTDLGYFTEEIAPGAFDPVMGDDVRALFNHEPDNILGRTKSGTLRIAIDQRGLKYEVDLNKDDPDAMKLYSRVKRGDISGSSFSFTVEEDTIDRSGEKPHRTITRLGQLYDVAPVTFPAYDAAQVSARAIERAKVEELPKPVSHEVLEKTLDLARLAM